MNKNINEIDIAVSTRVRLARNISGVPYPRKMNAVQAKELIDTVWSAFDNSPLKKELRKIDINTISDLENVGYAKKEAFGIYNVLMMADAHTVYGIGAGATTKIVKNENGILQINRIFSPKYPYEYLQDKQ